MLPYWLIDPTGDCWSKNSSRFLALYVLRRDLNTVKRERESISGVRYNRVFAFLSLRARSLPLVSLRAKQTVKPNWSFLPILFLSSFRCPFQLPLLIKTMTSSGMLRLKGRQPMNSSRAILHRLSFPSNKSSNIVLYVGYVQLDEIASQVEVKGSICVALC